MSSGSNSSLRGEWISFDNGSWALCVSMLQGFVIHLQRYILLPTLPLKKQLDCKIAYCMRFFCVIDDGRKYERVVKVNI